MKEMISINIEKQKKAEIIAKEFNEYMQEWHSFTQPYDDKMDADIFERYARVLKEQSVWGYFNFKKNPKGIERPFYSPSNAGISDRELYERARGSKRNPTEFTVNQRYWVGTGGVLGEYLQREVLLAERHYRKLTGKTPPFRMKRKDNGDPMYEHFVKKMHEVEHGGEEFAYFGLPDGVLEYIDKDTGEVIDVGLEIKSEQASWSKFKSLAEPKNGHIDQTIMYSDMYGFEYVVIAYILSYGRGWFEDFNRLKTFGRHISEDDRNKLRDRCADATKRAREGNPPKIDLDTWAFNDYKTAIAESLSEEEFDEIKAQVRRMLKSGLPDWKKQNYYDAFEFIKSVREAD